MCGLHIQLSGKCTFSQLFPSLCLKHCAGGHFDSILVFWELPRGTLAHHFAGWGRKKMRSEKMVQKVFKNGCAGHATKTAPGAVGPLKTDKIRQSDHQTLDRTRPGVPDGTVADMKLNVAKIWLGMAARGA